MFSVRYEHGILCVTYWLRSSVVVLSLHSPGFDPSRIHMRFVMCKVALGQVLTELGDSFSFTITTVLYSHHLEFDRTRRKNRARAGSNQKRNMFLDSNSIVIRFYILHTVFPHIRRHY